MGFNFESEENKVPAYNPYTKAQAERIKVLWSVYRETVGLEGDIYHDMMKKGLSENEIGKIISEQRTQSEKDREGWELLVKEHKFDNE